MPKIISSQEAKNLFLSDDFPQKGYFVIEMKKRPYAQVLELKEHMKKTRKERQNSINDKNMNSGINLSAKLKNKVKELIF
jgi:hypothetical protein